MYVVIKVVIKNMVTYSDNFILEIIQIDFMMRKKNQMKSFHLNKNKQTNKPKISNLKGKKKYEIELEHRSV